MHTLVFVFIIAAATTEGGRGGQGGVGTDGEGREWGRGGAGRGESEVGWGGGGAGWEGREKTVCIRIKLFRRENRCMCC